MFLTLSYLSFFLSLSDLLPEDLSVPSNVLPAPLAPLARSDNLHASPDLLPALPAPYEALSEALPALSEALSEALPAPFKAFSKAPPAPTEALSEALPPAIETYPDGFEAFPAASFLAAFEAL